MTYKLYLGVVLSMFCITTAYSEPTAPPKITPPTVIFYDAWGNELPPSGYEEVTDRPVLRLYFTFSKLQTLCDPSGDGVKHRMYFKACTAYTPELVESLLIVDGMPLKDKIHIQKELNKNLILCVELLSRGKSTIVVQGEVKHVNITPLELAAIIRHENAHCNGLEHEENSDRGWYLPSGQQVY